MINEIVDSKRTTITILGNVLLIVLMLLLSGCENSNDQHSVKGAVTASNEPLSEASIAEFRDWSKMLARGEIRALKLSWEKNSTLPRMASTAEYHQQLFEQFAALHNLEIKWVTADSLADMFARLARNEADIIPRHLTRLASRQEDFQFTRVVANDRELLIGSATLDDFSLTAANRILLTEMSSYHETVKQFPDWTINTGGKEISQYDVLADHLVNEPGLMTVLDKSAVDNLLSYRDDIKVLHEFDEATEQA